LFSIIVDLISHVKINLNRDHTFQKTYKRAEMKKIIIPLLLAFIFTTQSYSQTADEILAKYYKYIYNKGKDHSGAV